MNLRIRKAKNSIDFNKSSMGNSQRSRQAERILSEFPEAHDSRILFADYDPQWPELFGREADRIRAALGTWALVYEEPALRASLGFEYNAYATPSGSGFQDSRHGAARSEDALKQRSFPTNVSAYWLVAHSEIICESRVILALAQLAMERE